MIENLRDIDRLAGRAAMRVFTHQLGYDERHTIARSEMGLAIAENPEIDAYDLVARAVEAINAETSQWRRDHGIAAPVRFVIYWLDPVQELGRPDRKLPPRVALRQVWAALPERHQEALWLLALHGDPQTAAQHAGVTYAAMQARIRVARRAFYALWFDWEVPPTPPFDRRASRPLATHCGRGHEFTPENTRWRRASNGRGQKRACRACDAR